MSERIVAGDRVYSASRGGLVVTAASGEEAKGIAKSFLENAGFEVEHAPRLEAIEAENGE